MKKNCLTKTLAWLRKLIKKYTNCNYSNNFDFSIRLRQRLRLLIYPCYTTVYKDNICKFPDPPPAGMEHQGCTFPQLLFLTNPSKPLRSQIYPKPEKKFFCHLG